MRSLFLSIALTLTLALQVIAQKWPGGDLVDAAINQAVSEGRIPGAVLLVGHRGEVIYRKAYGSRALLPGREPMTVDTIFDCASLTKVVATTPSIMRLFEDGKVRLADKVTDYLPEFQGGNSTITINDLLIHFSGLRPDVDLEPEWSGYQTGIDKALHEKSVMPAGTKFVYSDINFLLLGEIVRRYGGESLADYARDHVFAPLHMSETRFQPPATLRSRIAPTEKLPTGEILRGTVHDPTARYMGGVAGHAGLFSTADDLAKYCQMMLNLGTSEDGARLYSPATVVTFTSPHTPLGQPVLRGLGWDIDSPLSGNRGELFPAGTSYGHTGFTGTSLWLDPASHTYVILLVNSVHPSRGKSITSLRGRIATIVAAQVGAGTGHLAGPTITGLDVWESQGFRALAGKRVGLITNHTGVDRDGRRNVDLMRAAGINLTAIFSPEHGILGAEDQPSIAGGKDPTTGIRVWSLYEGKNRRPSREMLAGIDVLVFDIADIGARFYTYITTMAYAMEEAAKVGMPFYVLDRPNPITGTHVDGPGIDGKLLSFVGYFPMPVRHGMTAGELATMFNAENHLGAKLTVVQLEGWRRGEWFEETGLPWVNPSPNIRSMNAALLYPGVALLEYAKNISVGRGTDAPFEWVGSEFMKGEDLSRELNRRAVPGLGCYPVTFQPASSVLAGKRLHGIRFTVTNRDSFDSGRFGLELLSSIEKLYPGKLDFQANEPLIGDPELLALIRRGQPAAAMRTRLDAAAKQFRSARAQYLLYR